METLEYGKMKKQYPEVLPELEKKFDNLEGVTVIVNEDYKNRIVELKIGRNNLTLTIRQAKDLALEIRKAANRLEKDRKGINPKKTRK